jgi:hypothetical protein
MAATVHPRLAARRARIRAIRRTAVALTVTLFIAVWALIFGTLASGHDPGLTAKHASAASGASSGGSSAASSGASSTLGSSSSSGDDLGSSSSSSAPPLSTHQS